MAKNFKELQARMSPARRQANAAAAQRMILEMKAGQVRMGLDEIRTMRDVTQEQVAETLGIKQAAVSKIENRTDMHVSTLARFIEATGGKLEIRAVFDDGTVVIDRLAK